MQCRCQFANSFSVSQTPCFMLKLGSKSHFMEPLKRIQKETEEVLVNVKITIISSTQ